MLRLAATILFFATLTGLAPDGFPAGAKLSEAGSVPTVPNDIRYLNNPAMLARISARPGNLQRSQPEPHLHRRLYHRGLA